MLYVMSGLPTVLKPYWLRDKLGDIFDYTAQEDWFDDPIVRDALLEIDNIVDVKGMVFIRKDGRCIPSNWLSQGVRQFIYMTQNNDKVCDYTFFGSNVYKFFYRWSTERDKDVYLLLCNYDATNIGKDVTGIFLNTGEVFHSGKELGNLIIDHRGVLLYDSRSGEVPFRKYRRNDDGKVVPYGKTGIIKVPFKE